MSSVAQKCVEMSAARHGEKESAEKRVGSGAAASMTWAVQTRLWRREEERAER